MSSLVLVVVVVVSCVKVQRTRASLLTVKGVVMLDQGRKATQRSDLDRAPPSAWPGASEVVDGLEDSRSEVAHTDGEQVLIHVGSPPLGQGPSTLSDSKNSFSFSGQKNFAAAVLNDRQLTILFFY